VENNAGFSVLPLAEETASKMFGEAGVTIDWRSGLVGCPPQGILISLFGPSDHAPADLAPSALAYALPYEGSQHRDLLRSVAAEGSAGRDTAPAGACPRP